MKLKGLTSNTTEFVENNTKMDITTSTPTENGVQLEKQGITDTSISEVTIPTSVDPECEMTFSDTSAKKGKLENMELQLECTMRCIEQINNEIAIMKNLVWRLQGQIINEYAKKNSPISTTSITEASTTILKTPEKNLEKTGKTNLKRCTMR